MFANKNNIKLGGNNQKLILFSLGNAMSGPPTSKGSKKLPKPPIIAGIIMKNIMRIACAVIMLLYSWLSAIYCTPGPDSSILINTEKAVPNSPANKANIKYRVPISLALLDKNQRSHQRDISAFLVIGSLITSSATLPKFGENLILNAGVIGKKGKNAKRIIEGL